jgi:hypothetical protein
VVVVRSVSSRASSAEGRARGRPTSLVLERGAFRFPFRRGSGGTGMGIGNGPAVADPTHGAEVGETGEGLAEAFVADTESCAEVSPRKRSGRESGEHSRLERAGAADVVLRGRRAVVGCRAVTVHGPIGGRSA